MTSSSKSRMLLGPCEIQLIYPLSSVMAGHRLKVMDAFDQIHQVGVQHDDIAERNVLVNEEGRVFIIDFEHSFPSKCKRRVPIPGLGDLGIERSKLLCNELWDLGWSLRMWKPRT